MANSESRDDAGESYHVEKALSRINERFVENGAKTVTENDLERIMLAGDDIRKAFSDAEPLRRFANDLELFLSLIDDHWNRRYGEAPYWSICIIVFSLIYVLSPLDLIPDAIPNIGHVDDAAVVSLCLKMTEKELDDYRTWKKNQSG